MSPSPGGFASDVADGCIVAVCVHPGTRKNTVIGVHNNAVKIALTAPPVEGRANEALIGFFAEILRLPKSRVAIIAGPASRSKKLRITGKSAAEVKAALFPVEFV